MPRQFQGDIKLDIRDSTPDWEAYLSPRAETGSPNVLVVLYGDTGQAAWSPYGGRINMPTTDRLAANGSPTPSDTPPRSARQRGRR
jgi:hypothetical protein